MRKISVVLIFLMVTFAGAEKKKTAAVDPLVGTWCTTDGGMVLTFVNGDTMRVVSTSDSGMGGSGLYTHTDSTFSATLKNSTMVMKMDYRYRWKGHDTVEAKATSFIIDNEAVEYPTEWMGMVRCAGKKAESRSGKSPVRK